jgi:hypothetical protein
MTPVSLGSPLEQQFNDLGTLWSNGSHPELLLWQELRQQLQAPVGLALLE